MGKIPFAALDRVESLDSLDLSLNRIEKLEDPFFKKRLTLDTLVLRENNVETLSENAFQNFEKINFTDLSGNPLRRIYPGAFAQTAIKHLDVSNGFVDALLPASFQGLEKSLEVLDLSANRLSELPEDVFLGFDNIHRLRLNDNMLNLSPNVTFNGFRYKIKDLELQGEDMRYVPLEEFGIMRSLRTVGLSAVRNYGSLNERHFEDFAPSLETLNLVDSDVTSLDRNAFRGVPGVSKLDVSNNRIGRIDDDAFRDVGNALVYLRMSNALYFTRLPNHAFQSLNNILTLDLSNNHIRDVPLDSFHKMSRLRHLYLQVN